MVWSVLSNAELRFKGMSFDTSFKSVTRLRSFPILTKAISIAVAYCLLLLIEKGIKLIKNCFLSSFAHYG